MPKDLITGKPHYDLDYALRICKENKRRGACVQLYAEMGLWEEAVDLALQASDGEEVDLELAKSLADRAEEEDLSLRKKLLLKIARFVVRDKKDIKSYVVLLPSTSAVIYYLIAQWPSSKILHYSRLRISFHSSPILWLSTTSRTKSVWL